MALEGGGKSWFEEVIEKDDDNAPEVLAEVALCGGSEVLIAEEDDGALSDEEGELSTTDDREKER
jgi:hypothetical protein